MVPVLLRASPLLAAIFKPALCIPCCVVSVGRSPGQSVPRITAAVSTAFLWAFHSLYKSFSVVLCPELFEGHKTGLPLTFISRLFPSWSLLKFLKALSLIYTALLTRYCA
uniref:Secreted protein n=1 Tax=Trypanosoma vivax (strain Y486) TaxID=1055687 RepID=G0UB13_TRYVY|nr:hypothetical protein TVY486_1104840 [Trypanosoma vivax Y486]